MNDRPLNVAVVGDSMTSGLFETKAVNWPKLLAKRPGIGEVHDLAAEGADCRKALFQAEEIPSDTDVVIVAIGGNDLLGPTTLAEFERDYESLLAQATRGGRRVVGFELPLPPFQNGWGAVQRAIASEYRVGLIPK